MSQAAESVSGGGGKYSRVFRLKFTPTRFDKLNVSCDHLRRQRIARAANGLCYRRPKGAGTDPKKTLLSTPKRRSKLAVDNRKIMPRFRKVASAIRGCLIDYMHGNRHSGLVRGRSERARPPGYSG